jgi:hypothetical protein
MINHNKILITSFRLNPVNIYGGDLFSEINGQTIYYDVDILPIECDIVNNVTENIDNINIDISSNDIQLTNITLSQQ